LLKWLLAFVLATGFVIIARASLQSTTYLPIIRNEEGTKTPTVTGTITITPTASRTPTVTGTLPTPTQTRTPTPTRTLVPGVFIVDIEYAPETHPLDEYVIIRNQTADYIPMAGWTLRDDSKNIYTFPQYTLISWASVKVWTKSGLIDPENLYWGRKEPVWNDYGDCAYLRDDEHKLMDSECYGTRGYLQSLFSNFP
jgi:hypothetical protein